MHHRMGGTTATMGSTRVQQCLCDRGYSGLIASEADVCTACPEGKYKDEVGQDCHQCPTGATSTSGSTAITSCVCNSGYSGSDITDTNSECTLCPVGTYKATAVSGDCTECEEFRTTVAPGSMDVADCTLIPCVDPPAPNTDSCYGVSGATCTGRCVTEEGYLPSGGSDSYTCAPSGEWTSGSLVCSLAACDGPPAPHTTQCSGSFGDSCTSRCAAGYVDAQQESADYTCGVFISDGAGPVAEWSSETGLVCEQVGCSGPPAGHTEECNGVAGSSCSARCSVGYATTAGDDAASSYTCSPTGEWVGGSLACVLAGCSGSPAPNAESCSGQFGETCTAACSDGFVDASGNEGVSYTCDLATLAGKGSNQGVAEWQAGADGGIVCELVSCSGPPTQNAEECAGVHTGKSCRARCLSGYLAQDGGDASYTCSADGQWEGGSLVCAGVECSGSPAENTEVCTGQLGTESEACEPTCVAGYVTQGDTMSYNCSVSVSSGAAEPAEWVGGSITCVLDAQHAMSVATAVAEVEESPALSWWLPVLGVAVGLAFLASMVCTCTLWCVAPPCPLCFLFSVFCPCRAVSR